MGQDEDSNSEPIRSQVVSATPPVARSLFLTALVIVLSFFVFKTGDSEAIVMESFQVSDCEEVKSLQVSDGTSHEYCLYKNHWHSLATVKETVRSEHGVTRDGGENWY